MGEQVDIEVTEIVPGEYDVRLPDRTVRVLVPPGVGVPGLGDEDLAEGVVAELAGRGSDVPAVIDVSGLLRTDPELLDRVAARLETQN